MPCTLYGCCQRARAAAARMPRTVPLVHALRATGTYLLPHAPLPSLALPFWRRLDGWMDACLPAAYACHATPAAPPPHALRLPPRTPQHCRLPPLRCLLRACLPPAARTGRTGLTARTPLRARARAPRMYRALYAPLLPRHTHTPYACAAHRTPVPAAAPHRLCARADAATLHTVHFFPCSHHPLPATLPLPTAIYCPHAIRLPTIPAFILPHSCLLAAYLPYLD